MTRTARLRRLFRGGRSHRAAERQARDQGLGMIELIMAMILLSLIGVGTLTAMTAAIKGSSGAENLSGSRRWLVSAADYVTSSNVTRVACTAGESAMRSAYQTAAQSVTTSRPAGWSASQITVVSPVLFWNGSTFGSTCYESNGLKLQQITFRAVDLAGSSVETVTVVKLDG